MSPNDLQRAWPAPKAPRGFADRVLEQLQRAPALPAPAARPSRWGWLTTRGLRWLAPAAIALSLAGVYLHVSTMPSTTGDVIASEPRRVELGDRAVAEMSSGAHIQWSENDVQQSRGDVTYRVRPGARFRVQTPHGSITALGTVFRVVVLERDETEGGPMKKRWAIAGAGATLGALLFVKVDEGSVRLSSAREDLTLGAGQAATVGSDGLVRVATEGLGASALPSVPAEPATHPQHGAKPIAPEAQRLRERVLDSLRARQQPNAAETAASKPAPGTHAPGTMADRTGELGQETMRVLNHEFIPLVDDCYDQARERNPRLRGMLALTVELAAAEDVGSIFETVEPAQDRNQIHDEELIDCVRQSAFSIQLPAPVKSGRTSLQLTIPLAAPGATVDAGR